MKFSFDSELFVASISSVETREPAGIFFFEFQQLFPVYSPSFSEILVGLAPLPWRFGGVWDPLSLSLCVCVCVCHSLPVVCFCCTTQLRELRASERETSQRCPKELALVLVFDDANDNALSSPPAVSRFTGDEGCLVCRPKAFVQPSLAFS